MIPLHRAMLLAAILSLHVLAPPTLPADLLVRIDENGSSPCAYRISCWDSKFGVLRPTIRRNLLGIVGHPGKEILTTYMVPQSYDYLLRSYVGRQNGKLVLFLHCRPGSYSPSYIVADASKLDRIRPRPGITFYHGWKRYGDINPFTLDYSYSHFHWEYGFSPELFTGQGLGPKEVLEEYLSAVATGDENEAMLRSVLVQRWSRHFWEEPAVAQKALVHLSWDAHARVNATFSAPILDNLKNLTQKQTSELIACTRDSARFARAELRDLVTNTGTSDKQIQALRTALKELVRVHHALRMHALTY